MFVDSHIMHSKERQVLKIDISDSNVSNLTVLFCNEDKGKYW